MKNQFCVFFLVLIVLSSCNDENQRRLESQKKEAQKKEALFATISKSWIFQSEPINEVAEKSMSFWTQWRSFINELAQKPKSSISAFQKKAKILTQKAIALKDNLPSQYDNPAIKSRISILITNVSLLDMYLHLIPIPTKKVVHQITEINLELIALQREMDKIDVKNKIPIEEGETDMLRMLDTIRAIPSNVAPFSKEMYRD